MRACIILVQRCNVYLEMSKVFVRDSKSGMDGSMSHLHRSIETLNDSMVFVRDCSDGSDASNRRVRESKATKKPPKGGFDVLR
jgi:hypothetical protein